MLLNGKERTKAIRDPTPNVKLSPCRKLNVLSFGEEVEEEEEEAETIKGKIKSIHDVLDDPRFLKEEAGKEPLVRILFSKVNYSFLLSICCIKYFLDHEEKLLELFFCQ